MADIDPNLIAALLARAPTSNIGLANDRPAPPPTSVEPYNPSTMDMIARALVGSQPPERGSVGGALSDLMLGTRGHGPTGPLPGGLSVADFTPVGPGAQFIDRSAQGDIPGAMASGVQAAMVTPGLAGRTFGAIRGGAEMGADTMAAIAQALMRAPKTTAAGAGVTAATAGSSEASPPAASPTVSEARTLFPDDPELRAMRDKRARMKAPSAADDPELTRLGTVIQQLARKIDTPADKKTTSATRNSWIADKAAADKAYQDRLAVLEGNMRTDAGGVDKEIATRLSDLKRSHPTYSEAYPTIANNPVIANALIPALMGMLVKGGQLAGTRMSSTRPWNAALKEGEAALAQGDEVGARASQAAALAYRDTAPAATWKKDVPAILGGVSGGEALSMGPHIHNSRVAPPGSAERDDARAVMSDPTALATEMGRGLVLGGLGGWTGAKMGSAVNSYIPGSVPPVARTEALGARIGAASDPAIPLAAADRALLMEQLRYRNMTEADTLRRQTGLQTAETDRRLRKAGNATNASGTRDRDANGRFIGGE